MEKVKVTFRQFIDILLDDVKEDIAELMDDLKRTPVSNTYERIKIVTRLDEKRRLKEHYTTLKDENMYQIVEDDL